jgi:hypothetical protein
VASWKGGAALVLILLLGTACLTLVMLQFSARTAVAESKERGQVLEQKIQALENQVAVLKEQVDLLRSELGQAQQDFYSHLYAGFERDKEGTTPDAIVRTYLEASMKKDWRTAYQCLTQIPEDLTLPMYTEDMDSSNEDTLYFTIGRYQLRSPDRAAVFVSYAVRYRATGREARFEMEPWAVVKTCGVWKVRWLPRQ